MSKNKRRRLAGKMQPAHRPLARPDKALGMSRPALQKPNHASSQHQRPADAVIPFHPEDAILLIGEGDFSFAVSLVKHHVNKFRHLSATCFDSKDELLEKFPQAEANIVAILETGREGNQSKVDTNTGGDSTLDSNTLSEHEEWNGFNSDREEQKQEPEINSNETNEEGESLQNTTSVHYSIDATRLIKPTQTPRAIRRPPTASGKWDRIVFNFPHTGGLSTDVNRQVRANQALLHSFLENCVSMLVPEGTVLVTLFEGEPYTLWNIRDLARSVGLKVVRSWKFDWTIWQGYQHARTVGNIQEKVSNVKIVHEDDAGNMRESRTLRPGKWRGEERDARTYEFALPEPAPALGAGRSTLRPKQRGEKRKQDKRSDSSDSE